MLKDMLIEMGFSVHLCDTTLPKTVLGRTGYIDKYVKIRKDNSKNVLKVMLHEAGHVLSFIKYGSNNVCKVKREFYAYLFGWYLIKKLNIKCISKKEWREFSEWEIFDYKNCESCK